ncbi:NAD(P)H-hydrate epimerase [Clostridium aminobutyricum]|uniref:NAD(P)H-hydrate epimerase n=1 Tax=Clostridium aminobutyricum TaxID=33953 RepID=A0A939IGC6_CLOAM|nr:NAD(P)H-hydrate epimerase [Clostridium aminobutyricum]MBN7773095.1 NAD(P)H-hydrate epimerase [Clostridium aminobutyricum]
MMSQSKQDRFSNEKYYQTVTCGEMKEIERKADASGLSYYKMMENAGKAAVQVILETLSKKLDIQGPPYPADAVIFCGKGNNGGDGYVAARELAAAGVNVTVVMADGEPRTEDAIKNANIVLRRGTPVIDARAYFDAIPEIVEAADFIVDAIYGTGFHGQLSETVRACTALINEKSRKNSPDRKKLVFALDIPTGLNGDAGEPDPDTITADYTIVFHRTKPVHELDEVAPYCGEIVAVGIGID